MDLTFRMMQKHGAIEEIENMCRVSIKSSCSSTNRFHVAVRLFINRSQMTSKCGKNKKKCHTRR